MSAIKLGKFVHNEKSDQTISVFVLWRQDVFAIRWDNEKSGTHGYAQNAVMNGIEHYVETHNYDPAIENRNPTLQPKKLCIDRLTDAVSKKNYNKNTKDNIFIVYNEIDSSQIFGALDIKKILDCSASTAKEIMKKIRDKKIAFYG